MLSFPQVIVQHIIYFEVILIKNETFQTPRLSHVCKMPRRSTTFFAYPLGSAPSGPAASSLRGCLVLRKIGDSPSKLPVLFVPPGSNLVGKRYVLLLH